MKTSTVSLKQLRTNPREYIRLINSGQNVTITEHSRPIAVTRQKSQTSVSKQGNTKAVLAAIAALPRVNTPEPEVDTPTRLKHIKDEHFKQKYGL